MFRFHHLYACEEELQTAAQNFDAGIGGLQPQRLSKEIFTPIGTSIIFTSYSLMINRRHRSRFLFLVYLWVCTTCPAGTADFSDDLSAAMQKYKHSQSEISEAILAKDHATMLSIEPKVRSRLIAGGFTDIQVGAAIIKSWKAHERACQIPSQLIQPRSHSKPSNMGCLRSNQIQPTQPLT